MAIQSTHRLRTKYRPIPHAFIPNCFVRRCSDNDCVNAVPRINSQAALNYLSAPFNHERIDTLRLQRFEHVFQRNTIFYQVDQLEVLRIA